VTAELLTPPVVAPAAPVTGPRRPHRRPTLLLLLPLVTIFVVGFVLPLIFIIVTALQAPDGTFGIDQFATIVQTPRYVELIGRTLLLALTTTVISAAIGYPLAIAIARGPRALRGVLLAVVMMPMLTSVVVKTFGWSVLLSSTGPLQQGLDAVGLGSVRLLFSPVGVTVGLVHTYFPFMVLSLIAAIAAIDRRTEEAAQSLGSGPLQVFWKVTFPQSLEGLAAGSALTFVTSMSALVTPQLLGGGRVTTIVTVIFQQATAAQNWSLAAALGIVLLALTFLILSLQALAVRRVLRR
jgi:putative spermidine/putrescine transport system permease protein